MENDTWLVPPEELRASGSVPADEKVVEEYRKLPVDTTPPIQVVKHPGDGHLYVVDGHHTLVSTLRRGDKEVPVQWFTENEELNNKEAEKRRLRWMEGQRNS